MADKFCRQCGAPVLDGAKMCKYCMAPVEADGIAGEEGTAEHAGAAAGKVNIRKEVSGSSGADRINISEKKDRTDENQMNVTPYKIYGVLAYFGIGVLVPILFKMNVRFVRFHVNQGLALFLAEALLSLVYGFVGGLPVVAMCISIARLLCVLWMVLGMISVVRGSVKPLPLMGRIHLVRE